MLGSRSVNKTVIALWVSASAAKTHSLATTASVSLGKSSLLLTTLTHTWPWSFFRPVTSTESVAVLVVCALAVGAIALIPVAMAKAIHLNRFKFNRLKEGEEKIDTRKIPMLNMFAEYVAKYVNSNELLWSFIKRVEGYGW